MDIKSFIRKIVGKAAGVNKVQESVDTLFYFLNTYMDISSVPKATGDLRALQECDELLMQMFDYVCRKNNLTYWIEAGTLLGAVRHGGFVPWDDDIDICMPRDEYERAYPILRKEFEKYGIQVDEDMLHPMGRIGIGYKHKQTGIWMDIFPMDYYSKNLQDEENRKELNQQISRYNKFHKTTDYSKIQKRRKRVFGGLCEKEQAVAIFNPPEFVPKLIGWNMDVVFPLQELQFEGHSYYAPNKLHEYLVEMYGNDYMKFPRTGVLHHGDDSDMLINWARKTNTNMESIKKEMESIFASLKNEV